MELRHFDKHIVKNSLKKDPLEKHFEAFSPRYSLNYILMENLTQRWTQSGPFCPKSGHIRFSKGTGDGSPLPLSCASVTIA